MFSERHYIPILKGKEGELRALYYLDPSIKKNLTPLIDVPRRKIDPSTRKPKGDLESHLFKKIQLIAGNWGRKYPIFIDLFDINPGYRTSTGEHYVDYLFKRLQEIKFQAIPTTGTDRDEDYQKSISNIINPNNREICIRLLDDDIESPIETYHTLKSLLKTLKITEEIVHLLLDFRDISIGEEQDSINKAINFLRALPNINAWKSMIISSSGFPQTLGGVTPNSKKKIPRTELKLRRLLLNQRANLPRIPIYSDYGICHPDHLDFNPRTHKRSAAIRYTTEEDWLIIKGMNLEKEPGQKQFLKLAKELCSHVDYYGPSFSHGDKFIEDCANNTRKSGSLTTWRMVGTSHHLTLVVEQLANPALTLV